MCRLGVEVLSLSVSFFSLVVISAVSRLVRPVKCL